MVRADERSGLRPEVVLSGTCRGVDKLGERWTKEHGVPIERYPADWKLNPKYAGNLRNTTMVPGSGCAIAIFGGYGVRVDRGSET